MLESFIAKIIHATVKLKAKLLIVEDKAIINVADIQKLVDNGQVYGETKHIRELVPEPGLMTDEKPTAGKNCNYEGLVARPARADHTHKIPGKGTGTSLGHVKLCDDIDKDYDKNSGWAATPKAIKSLSNIYLKLDGTSQMSGTLKTVGNSSATSFQNARQSLKIGSASYFTDLGNSGITHVMCANKTENGALAFGSDLSTVLLSKNNGHLYLRDATNKNYVDEEGHMLTVDGERMILDYTIEAFIGKNGTFYWTPARVGWYRIYVIGHGGKGAKGFAYGPTNRTGAFHKYKDGNLITAPHSDYANCGNYETPKQPAGVAIAGCGGGGGGVAIVDIYVSPNPYSYIGKKNKTTKVLRLTEDGEPVVNPETGEFVYDDDICYVESAVSKVATIKIDNNVTTVSNLFSVTGTNTRYEEDETPQSDDGDTTDSDVDVPDLVTERDVIRAFKGMNAVIGKVIDKQSYSKKKQPDSTARANVGKDVMGQYYGVKLYGTVTDTANNVTVYENYYYLRFGKRWDKAAMFGTGVDPESVWICYNISHKEVYRLPHGKKGQVGSFCDLIIQCNGAGQFREAGGTKNVKYFTTAMLEAVGASFAIGARFGLPIVDPSNYAKIPDDNETSIYQMFTAIFSSAGLGGNATSGDVNFVGGAGGIDGSEIAASGLTKYGRTGQDKPMKNTADEFDNPISGVDDTVNFKNFNDISCSGNTMRVRADGYCGGVPGRIGLTGSYGGLGGAGDMIQASLFQMTPNGEKIAATEIGTIFARNGYGSGLNITELGNYSGDISEVNPGFKTQIKTTQKQRAGMGYYGGGGGGGAALISRKKDGKGKANAGGVHSSGGGNGCVVIAYFGDCKPKYQTNLTGKAPTLDSNGDGVSDYLEVILTYVKDPDGSVDTLVYDQRNTGVLLYDEEHNLSEWGTGTITDAQRPTTVTPTPGYTGSPIYNPSGTTVNGSSPSVITVSFAKDTSKWFTVSFSAGAGGAVTGALSYPEVLENSPIVPTGETPPALTTNQTAVLVPTPVPDEGYVFDCWSTTVGETETRYEGTTLMPTTVTASATYVALFKKA